MISLSSKSFPYLPLRDQVLFSPNVNGDFNPYSPDGSLQFSMPTGIADEDGIVDEHGQFQSGSTFLDVLFDYVDVGELESNDPPSFGDSLKELLVESYSQEERNNRLIEYYNECKDDEDDDRAEDCKMQLETLEKEQDNLVRAGRSRVQLDDSIAMVFGNKTTVGQICAYSRGLEDNVVDDITGFCCLDAPYESKDWGEIFTCQKYVLDTSSAISGKSKVVQKKREDCNRLAPLTSGFNQAACGTF